MINLRSSTIAGHEFELSHGRNSLTITMRHGIPIAFIYRTGAHLCRWRLEGYRLNWKLKAEDWASCAPVNEEEFHRKLRIALRQVVMPG